MNHSVYLLRCADGTLYAGWTTDPVHRTRQHNAGRGAKYTRARRPVELVYLELLPGKRDALRREYALKQLSHAEKLALISGPTNQLNWRNSPMAIIENSGVIHIGFNTADLDAALRFYCGLFGMQVQRQAIAPEDLPEDAPLYPLRGKPFITWLTDGATVLELFSPMPGRDANAVTANSLGFTHFAIGVPDVRAAVAALREAGVTIDSEPQEGGSQAAWIRDPDGNRIELMAK